MRSRRAKLAISTHFNSKQQAFLDFVLAQYVKVGVEELAALVGLKPPTVSHHLSKMHSAGLLNLRMAGTQRFYRINEKRMAQFKSYVQNIEALALAIEEAARSRETVRLNNFS